MADGFRSIQFTVGLRGGHCASSEAFVASRLHRPKARYKRATPFLGRARRLGSKWIRLVATMLIVGSLALVGLSRPAFATAASSAPHVMVVMMENKNFSEVIGQSDQPYTNSLATSYGLATQSYAFGHPSLPNYLDLVSGSGQGVTADPWPSTHSFPGTPTLADQLRAAGIGEKAYAENLPRDPTMDSGEYAVALVPWEYFPGTPIPVADASSLIPDLNSADAPDFVWYTPNLIDNEHNGTVQQGDAFLSSLISRVQST